MSVGVGEGVDVDLCVCIRVCVCFCIGFYTILHVRMWLFEILYMCVHMYFASRFAFLIPFSRCNNTILFSCLETSEAKYRKSKNEKATEKKHSSRPLFFIAFSLSYFSFITFYSFHFHYSYKTHTIHMARAFAATKIKWKCVYDMAARSLAKCFEMAKQLNTEKVHVYLQNDQQREHGYDYYCYIFAITLSIFHK